MFKNSRITPEARQDVGYAQAIKKEKNSIVEIYLKDDIVDNFSEWKELKEFKVFKLRSGNGKRISYVKTKRKLRIKCQLYRRQKKQDLI